MPCEGPNTKDYGTLGSILGSPYFRKLPYNLCAASVSLTVASDDSDVSPVGTIASLVAYRTLDEAAHPKLEDAKPPCQVFRACIQALHGCHVFRVCTWRVAELFI